MANGVNISPSVFSGGAVVFNTQPETNLYGQLLAKKQAIKQAKSEAFDNYLNELGSKLTPTGVRDVDLEAFAAKKKAWQEFGLKNKEKLLKKDIAAQSELNRLYQEALSVPVESKQAEEGKKPLVEILTDPNKRSRLSSNVFPAIRVHDEPLYIKDPATGQYTRNINRKPLDYTSSLFNPQFDFTKAFEQWSKGIDKKEATGGIISRDPVTGTVKVETIKQYAPENFRQIAANAARSVKDNPDYGNYYQAKSENIDIESDEYKQLNKAYQEVFGANSIVDTAEELAAAEAILQAKQSVERGAKEILDRELASQRAQININLNKAGTSVGGLPTGNAFDAFADSKFKNFYVKNGQFYNNDGTPYNTPKGGTFITGDVLPTAVRSALSAGGIKPELLNKGVNAVIEDGVLKSISNPKVGTITREAMEGVYQPKFDTEAQKAPKLKFNTPKETKPAKTETRKFTFPNGKTKF